MLPVSTQQVQLPPPPPSPPSPSSLPKPLSPPTTQQPPPHISPPLVTVPPPDPTPPSPPSPTSTPQQCPLTTPTLNSPAVLSLEAKPTRNGSLQRPRTAPQQPQAQLMPPPPPPQQPALAPILASSTTTGPSPSIHFKGHRRANDGQFSSEGRAHVHTSTYHHPSSHGHSIRHATATRRHRPNQAEFNLAAQYQQPVTLPPPPPPPAPAQTSSGHTRRQNKPIFEKPIFDWISRKLGGRRGSDAEVTREHAAALRSSGNTTVRSRGDRAGGSLSPADIFTSASYTPDESRNLQRSESVSLRSYPGSLSHPLGEGKLNNPYPSMSMRQVRPSYPASTIDTMSLNSRPPSMSLLSRSRTPSMASLSSAAAYRWPRISVADDSSWSSSFRLAGRMADEDASVRPLPPSPMGSPTNSGSIISMQRSNSLPLSRTNSRHVTIPSPQLTSELMRTFSSSPGCHTSFESSDTDEATDLLTRSRENSIASTKPTTVISFENMPPPAHIAVHSSPSSLTAPHTALSADGSLSPVSPRFLPQGALSAGEEGDPRHPVGLMPPDITLPSENGSGTVTGHPRNVPKLSRNHPRNNPHPSSAPPPDASTMTLASSIYPFGRPGSTVGSVRTDTGQGQGEGRRAGSQRIREGTSPSAYHPPATGRGSLSAAPTSYTAMLNDSGGGRPGSIAYSDRPTSNYDNFSSHAAFSYRTRTYGRADDDASMRAIRRRGSWESGESRWSWRPGGGNSVIESSAASGGGVSVFRKDRGDSIVSALSGGATTTPTGAHTVENITQAQLDETGRSSTYTRESYRTALSHPGVDISAAEDLEVPLLGAMAGTGLARSESPWSYSGPGSGSGSVTASALGSSPSHATASGGAEGIPGVHRPAIYKHMYRLRRSRPSKTPFVASAQWRVENAYLESLEDKYSELQVAYRTRMTELLIYCRNAFVPVRAWPAVLSNAASGAGSSSRLLVTEPAPTRSPLSNFWTGIPYQSSPGQRPKLASLQIPQPESPSHARSYSYPLSSNSRPGKGSPVSTPTTLCPSPSFLPLSPMEEERAWRDIWEYHATQDVVTCRLLETLELFDKLIRLQLREVRSIEHRFVGVRGGAALVGGSGTVGSVASSGSSGARVGSIGSSRRGGAGSVDASGIGLGLGLSIPAGGSDTNSRRERLRASIQDMDPPLGRGWYPGSGSYTYEPIALTARQPRPLDSSNTSILSMLSNTSILSVLSEVSEQSERVRAREGSSGEERHSSRTAHGRQDGRGRGYVYGFSGRELNPLDRSEPLYRRPRFGSVRRSQADDLLSNYGTDGHGLGEHAQRPNDHVFTTNSGASRVGLWRSLSGRLMRGRDRLTRAKPPRTVSGNPWSVSFAAAQGTVTVSGMRRMYGPGETSSRSYNVGMSPLGAFTHNAGASTSYSPSTSTSASPSPSLAGYTPRGSPSRMRAPRSQVRYPSRLRTTSTSRFTSYTARTSRSSRSSRSSRTSLTSRTSGSSRSQRPSARVRPLAHRARRGSLMPKLDEMVEVELPDRLERLEEDGGLEAWLAREYGEMYFETLELETLEEVSAETSEAPGTAGAAWPGVESLHRSASAQSKAAVTEESTLKSSGPALSKGKGKAPAVVVEPATESGGPSTVTNRLLAARPGHERDKTDRLTVPLLKRSHHSLRRSNGQMGLSALHSSPPTATPKESVGAALLEVANGVNGATWQELRPSSPTITIEGPVTGPSGSEVAPNGISGAAKQELESAFRLLCLEWQAEGGQEAIQGRATSPLAPPAPPELPPPTAPPPHVKSETICLDTGLQLPRYTPQDTPQYTTQYTTQDAPQETPPDHTPEHTSPELTPPLTPLTTPTETPYHPQRSGTWRARFARARGASPKPIPSEPDMSSSPGLGLGLVSSPGSLHALLGGRRRETGRRREDVEWQDVFE